jgi:hypothetical protein
MAKTLNPGDRVAYSAAFIKQIQADYWTTQRRGTFVKYISAWGPSTSACAIVKWDDQDAALSKKIGCFADDDYVQHTLEHGGTLVNSSVIAKHGSSAFTS